MTQPSLEKKIVSSSLKSNEAFVRIDKASKIENAYTPYTSYLLKLIGRFYDNDKDAKNVDVDVLIGWIEQDIPIKNQSLYINYLRECSGVDVSAINIADLVLSTRKKNIGNKLAQALLEDDSNKINSLKEQYDSLDVAEEEEEEEDFCGEGVSELLAVEQAGIGARIKLLPKRLNEICKSRARRGHHIVLFARPECFSADSQLLTTAGWKPVGAITREDKVASVDAFRNVSWEHPNQLTARTDFAYGYNIRNKKGQIDLLVSPGHRMIYEVNGAIKEETAEEIRYYQGMKTYTSAFATGSKVWGPLDVVAVAYQADGRTRVYESHGYSGEGFGHEITVYKQRKVERLRTALEQAGIEYSTWETSRGHTGFYFRLPNKLDKDFSWLNINEISVPYARKFAEELGHWDGSFRSDTRWKYSNTNEEAIDKAQAVVCLAGYSTFKSKVVDKREYIPCYELHIRSSYAPIDGQSITKTVVENPGTMYCLSVSTGMVLVRRNGVVSVQGNTGKTAATLTLAYGFALQGLETIIFGNEEPVHDTRMRAMCCFTGLTEDEIKAGPQKAQELLDKRGWNLVRFIPLHPGTPKQIERYVDRYKPDVIIVDQIRNLAVGAETRVNQLEMAATAIRNIAKRHNCLGISITQAGDSADNKLVLEMGDVDFSNCLAKGTQVLMYDGSKKAVEDIRIGEQVMGMDGTIRNVLATGRGVQPLYKITHKNGDNYTVNQSHIMTVRNSDNRMEAGIAGGCVGDLPLQTLLDRPGLLKRLKGIWSEGSDFITKSLPIDPYLFGLWLADGFSHTFSISTSDEQLANYLCNKYKKLVPSTRIVNVKNIIVSFMRQNNGHRNPLNNVLRGLGVIRNKHIPDVYLRSSREQRLQLLAGLIDGDGSLRRTKTTASDCFTIYIGDNEQLANDTLELCKSLGFYCTKGKSHPTCFVVRLSGAVTKIPTVLDRKKATRDSQIRFLSSNLTIEKVTDSGEFYGITVDKDKRYVLGNYIVTHNTGIPATADLMVGIGVNKEYEANGMRVLSTPKNKIGGVHSNFPVKINTAISRLEDI